MSDPRSERTQRAVPPVTHPKTPYKVDSRAGAQPCFACGVREDLHASLGCKLWSPLG